MTMPKDGITTAQNMKKKLAKLYVESATLNVVSNMRYIEKKGQAPRVTLTCTSRIHPEPHQLEVWFYEDGQMALGSGNRVAGSREQKDFVDYSMNSVLIKNGTTGEAEFIDKDNRSLIGAIGIPQDDVNNGYFLINKK